MERQYENGKKFQNSREKHMGYYGNSSRLLGSILSISGLSEEIVNDFRVQMLGSEV